MADVLINQGTTLGVDNGGARGAEAPPDFSPYTMYNQGLIEPRLDKPLV